MLWMCENGHIFSWIRHSENTKPSECPVCGSKVIDALEW